VNGKEFIMYTVGIFGKSSLGEIISGCLTAYLYKPADNKCKSTVQSFPPLKLNPNTLILFFLIN